MSEQEVLDCSICLQTMIHPTKLPCNHVFCFLCIKGVAFKSHRCALCRGEIPQTFLDEPDFLDKEKIESSIRRYSWFYEGRNGWWQYDDRTCEDLEAAYLENKDQLSTLIAGNVYCIDFRVLHQFRLNDPAKFRRVKRDYSSRPKKGIGGVKMPFKYSPICSGFPTKNPFLHLSALDLTQN